jgi:hypothetical protein
LGPLSLTGPAAAPGEDPERLAPGEVTPSDLSAGGAGQGEARGTLAQPEAVVAHPAGNRCLALLQPLASQTPGSESTQQHEAPYQDDRRQCEVGRKPPGACYGCPHSAILDLIEKQGRSAAPGPGRARTGSSPSVRVGYKVRQDEVERLVPNRGRGALIQGRHRVNHRPERSGR